MSLRFDKNKGGQTLPCGDLENRVPMAATTPNKHKNQFKTNCGAITSSQNSGNGNHQSRLVAYVHRRPDFAKQEKRFSRFRKKHEFFFGKMSANKTFCAPLWSIEAALLISMHSDLFVVP